MYSVEQAVSLVKQTAYTKFDGTVDVAVRLGVDPRHADRWSVARSSAARTGKSVRVAGDRARETGAKEAESGGRRLCRDRIPGRS